MPAVGKHGLPNQVPWGPTCWRGFRHDQYKLEGLPSSYYSGDNPQ